jgi:hypothetical protein
VAAFEARMKQPALVFLLSDFLTDDCTPLARALTRLQARHDVIALVVTDPREATWPMGHARMAVRDLETGAVTVYHLSPHNRRLLELRAQARQAQLQQLFHNLGMASVVVTPHSNYVEDLTQLFQRRRRRSQG